MSYGSIGLVTVSLFELLLGPGLYSIDSIGLFEVYLNSLQKENLPFTYYFKGCRDSKIGTFFFYYSSELKLWPC